MQIVVIAVLILAAFFLIRIVLREAAPEIAANAKKLVFYIVLAILAGLALTGRLAWLLAGIGALAAAMLRLAPVIAQFSPILARLFLRKDAPGSGNSSHQQARSGNERMSREEALRILGLESGADRRAIIEAHRRLIQKLHPDRGGSDFLAAQINQARKLLLNE
jgi:hypothetical protein